MRIQLAVVILSLALSSVWSVGIKQLVLQNALKLQGLQDALDDMDAEVDAENGEIQDSLVRIESGIHSLSKLLDSETTTEEPDYCGNISYTVLDETWRFVNASGGTHCDRDTLTAGWYRFLLNGTNAVIPTSCVPSDHCGTTITIWLDLQGQALPGVGQEIQANGCGSFLRVCCIVPQPAATVRNCGSYYIYLLQLTTNCYQAYCATPM